MIKLTRLQGSPLYLNEDLIETIVPSHDIVVNLTNGHTYVVSEDAEEVLARILEAKADVLVAAVRRAGVRINVTHDTAPEATEPLVILDEAGEHAKQHGEVN